DSTGLTPNLYLYRGEQFDPNLGLLYLRARYYDTTLGRFASTDPLQGSLTQPLSLNRYLYANSNPVSNVDPSGRETLIELNIVVAIQATLVNLFLLGQTLKLAT